MHWHKSPSHRVVVVISLLVLGLVSAARVQAEIILDFSADQATGDFFGNHPTAKAALEAAVADINAVLDLNLGAITQDVATGTSPDGNTVVNINIDYQYTHPATGGSVLVPDSTLAANEIRIFVGARNLTGSLLGEGGPAGLIQGGGFSGPGIGADFAGAISDLEANNQHARGDGPTIATFSGDIFGDPYSYDVGVNLGNLWFDQDTDNDGNADDIATLESSWHFDHTTAVAPGKDDFYSVALHETLHAIGVGGAKSWTDLVSGTDWLGSEVIALNGSGLGVINAGGYHFAAGLISTRISDGAPQEVVMDPNLAEGSRKTLTELDLAVLRDIGYSTVTAVPEPSCFALLMIVSSVYLGRRNRYSPG